MQLSEPAARSGILVRRPSLPWQVGAVLFVLAVPLVLITTSVRIITQDISFYQYEFEKYNVSQRTKLSSDELTRVARAFGQYFDSADEWLTVTVTDQTGRTFALFNQRELLHMRDVKGLFQLVWRIQALAGLGIAGYALARFLRFGQAAIPDLRRLTVWGGVATLLLVAALGSLALVDFGAVFLQFHLLSFSNDLWQLDPARDYLLMLFPEGFFFEATLAIAALTVIGALALIGLAGFLAPALERRSRDHV